MMMRREKRSPHLRRCDSFRDFARGSSDPRPTPPPTQPPLPTPPPPLMLVVVVVSAAAVRGLRGGGSRRVGGGAVEGRREMVAVLDPDIIVGWDLERGSLATFSSAHRT